MQSFIERLLGKEQGYFNGFFTGLFGVWEDLPKIFFLVCMNYPFVIAVFFIFIGIIIGKTLF